MEQDPEAYKEREAVGKQNWRMDQMEQDPKAYREREAVGKQHWRTEQMEKDAKAHREKEALGRQERRQHEMNINPEKYRLKEKVRKQVYRQTLVDSCYKRKEAFLSSIQVGRIFFCICCHRQLYDNQVIGDEVSERGTAHQTSGVRIHQKKKRASSHHTVAALTMSQCVRIVRQTTSGLSGKPPLMNGVKF